MDDPASIPQPLREQFARNLQALQTRHSALSGQLATLTLPPGVRHAVGRDGHSTFLLTQPNGGQRWLGGSSMPSISAEELFGRWQPPGGNVILPGILTGQEVLLIAARLELHGALFVIERDPVALKLALHLHDYTEQLASGRLVVLLVESGPPAIESHFIQFFTQNPGYEMPLRILSVPHLRPVEMSELQQALERVAAHIQAFQARRIQQLSESIGQFIAPSPASGALPKRVAVLSTTAGPQAAAHAERLARGLRALRIPHVECLPDLPSKCHLLARLESILEFEPELLLFCDSHPGPSRKLLPASLPVISWYAATSSAVRSIDYPVGPADLFIAESARVAAELVNLGASPAQVHRIAPGADNAAERPLDSHAAPASLRPRGSVLFFCDLPDDRPESADVTLDSHRALWQALQNVARQSAHDYRDSRADVLLSKAQKESGVAIQDPKLKEAFLAVLRTRIAPHACAVAALQRLHQSGHNVDVFGHGWSTALAQSARLVGPIPCAQARFTAFSKARCVILPLPGPESTELILDVLLAGCSAVVRTGQTHWTSAHPDLSEIDPFVATYRNLEELQMRVLKPTEAAADLHSKQATVTILSRHMVAHRLQSVLTMAANPPFTGSTTPANLIA